MNSQDKISHPTTFSTVVKMLLATICALLGTAAQAQEICERNVTADIVAMDQPVLFNRLGASNVNGMIFALTRDVVAINAVVNGGPNGDINVGATAPIPTANLAAFAGNVGLRPDKRPRPLVLRVREGDCVTITLTNLLTPLPNPIKPATIGGDPLPGNETRPQGPNFPDPVPIDGINTPIDEQVADRHVSFHVAGLQWLDGNADGSFVGNNADSTVALGGSATYRLYAEQEGAFIARGMATTVGSDANQGNSSNLLFGEVIVEPKGARIYRSQTTEEEMRLASTDQDPNSLTCGVQNLTPDGQPVINYEATYPLQNCNAPVLQLQCLDGSAPDATTGICADGLAAQNVNIGGTGADLGALVWAAEGKDGLPILNMFNGLDIVHSEINGLIVGPDLDGTWKSVCASGSAAAPAQDCPYPLESIGKRNPSLPNRLEPFRDFASVFHDEPATAQAYPGFYKTDPVFRYVLAGVKDGFMINYGSGGIGSEIISNRLGVGPMHDCLTCAYEEFFLTAYTVGDPAQLTDVAANMGLEALMPADLPDPTDPASVANFAATWGPALGAKATYVPYPEDPANVHHSYIGDFTKFRNVHVGAEQHVFHLHNHQWLYNPNDDNSNYLDAQGIGPGIGYTYEINFGGSGNRIKSAGDAIFHCHFYPHFAQGMWYLWRNHDVLETGTPLQASGAPNAFHTATWALENGTPLLVDAATGARARALPDGEIVVGAPIPAIIPLPGKALAPMPGVVNVVPNTLVKQASMFHPLNPGGMEPVGSLAKVSRTVPDPVSGGTRAGIVHPGYPFWIGGIEDIVGQRPPTPPLDMATQELAAALAGAAGKTGHVTVYKADGSIVPDLAPEANLFGLLEADQAGGFDGGLPRSALQGYVAGGSTEANVISPIDFSKVLGEAQAVFFPEEGTDVEQASMAYHSIRNHASYTVTMDGAVANANFVLNGVKPAIGAPFHEPCVDDQGDRFDAWNDPLTAADGHVFWGGEPNTWTQDATDESSFDADHPRIYKGANIQFDAVLNKAGYHYPQQRIIALWEDAVPIISKAKPPEPLVMRFNSFECGVYHHTNLVPETYELDDYQVRTPTDIIGQHIHLPKWDLTTADGSANGWNYEDGTLSPGAVQERIHAVNAYTANVGQHRAATGAPATFVVPTLLEAKSHPYFGGVSPPGTLTEKWMGARTTMQRWFFDPVLNSDGIDRGLGIIFTHDHYGPSTHQQVGLYATVLTEPAGSSWYHNETGEVLGDTAPGVNPAGRMDGGPTSWQAIIEPKRDAAGNLAGTALNPAGQMQPYREFYFEYSDFQHAYEAGVYVGANQDGEPIGGIVGADRSLMAVENLGNPANCGDAANAFRCAINPPARLQKVPVFPDLVDEIATSAADPINNFCPQRPCPQAIDVQDPGMFAVNYRNEPVALRVYDPNKLGPDGLPGAQADGVAGDLAFALASSDKNAQPIIRKFEVSNFAGASTLPPINPLTGGYQVLNIQPKGGNSIYGTVFAPPINSFNALKGGDPYTPMMRTIAGDHVRVKMQAGGDEEEHVATIHGLKWLQAGSGFGGAPNSGWRNAQAAGISEQFTLSTPVIGVVGQAGNSVDYPYSMDVSQDGWWSGMWGLMRVYNNKQNDLTMLSTSPVATNNKIKIDNAGDFIGACPAKTEGKGKNATTVTANLRQYSVTAVLANDILGKPAGMTITDPNPLGHVGGSPNDAGTLVYNSRTGSNALGIGPIHDPTAILYVRTVDMVNPDDPTAGLKPGVPVEPLILRANAGDCIDVTLRNRLLTRATVGGAPVIDANGNAVFLNEGGATFVADAAGLSLCGATTCTAVDAALVSFDQMPELATYGTLLGANKRDRGNALGATPGAGATTFQPNLLHASPYVGMHAQLVEFDGSRDNGIHAGKNNANSIAAPGQETSYRWYAGHIGVSVVEGKRGSNFLLTPTPVELGGSSLQPADVIKQGMKSMVGQLVIEPAGSTWPDALNDLEARAGTDPNADANGPARKTRAMVDVRKSNGDTFRDLSTVWAKGLTQYYSNNQPVEHLNGEGVGIPEDPQDSTGMAINYGIEPVWFRLGLLPNAPPGNADTPGSFGELQQFDVFSNGKVGGDPQTPVFTAPKGAETRMRITMASGTNRGSTFALHGHVWQRDPYITQNNVNGFPKAYLLGGPGVGSQTIGHNPLGLYMGGQESIWPSTHYEIWLPSAGGKAAVPGDYMFRDMDAIGSASGLWGILRVK